MSTTNLVPEATTGDGEPANSRVISVLFFVGLIGLLALYNTVFGWDSFPVLGDIVPMLGNFGSGGILYYLMGILIGLGYVATTVISEVLSD